VNPIAIIIPTLDQERGDNTGRLALVTAMCDARLIVVNGPKRGFTKTVNEGLRQTTNEDVCILNDDITRFQHGWLRALHKGLYSNPHYGIIGPSGKSAAVSKEGKLGMSGIEAVRQLSFWCVLIRREVINAIGILDERFIHYCSDNEYCIRAARRGWKCAWMKSVYLEHIHHGSGLQSKWKQQDTHELNRFLRRHK
jgi:GT2 family glycosyltransferase